MSDSSCKTYDFSDEKDYAHIIKLLGGENRLAQYPQVKKALEKQRQKDAECGIKPYKTILEEDTDDLCNAVYFPGIYYEKSENKLVVYYALSYSQKPMVQWYIIKVYDDKGAIIAQKRCSPPQPKKFTAEKCEFFSIPKSPRYKVELTDLTTFTDRYLSVTSLQESVAHCLEAEPVFDARAQVLAPKKNRDDPLQDLTGDDAPIRAIYNRYPQGDHSVDYVYDDARRGDFVQVMLEAAGNIELSRRINTGALEMGQPLAIMDFGSGAVRFDEKMADLQVADRTFQWLFRPEWGQNAPLSYYLAATKVNLTYKVGFRQRPLVYDDILYMSSLLEEDMGCSCRKIRPMEVSLGCVKEGTPVRMADGTEKPIEDIMIGEKVKADENGRYGVVTNVWSGKDTELFCIETADGHKAAVTAGHYVAADTGYVRADKMNMAMRVLTEDGIYQPLKYLYTVREPVKVYNLSVEVPGKKHGVMICGGICLADNDYRPDSPRSSLMESPPESSLSEEVAELKKLIAEFMNEV